MNAKHMVVTLVCLAALAGVVATYCFAQEQPGGRGAAARPLPAPPENVRPGAPMAGAPMPDGMRAMPPHREMEQAEQMERMLGMIRQMQRVCFDPATVGMIAVGGIKDEVRRKPDAIIGDLEELLKNTKTQGLRNAIHMTLKDMYKAQGDDALVLEHLKAMVKENDHAMSQMHGPAAGGPMMAPRMGGGDKRPEGAEQPPSPR